MMTQGVEKRRCHRFEVPGGIGRYKKTGPLHFFRSFSKVTPVIDVSKGGLSLECEDKLRKGDKIKIELQIPTEEPIILRSLVLRHGQPRDRVNQMACVKFAPFGKLMGGNSSEALEVLKCLESQYCTLS